MSVSLPLSLRTGMYLHEMADPEASFTKEEMQVGKHTEYEKRLIQYYLDLLSKEKDQKLNRKNQTNSQSFDEKIESKTILIQNGSQNTQKDRQFQEINDKNSGNAFGGDETSNDSVIIRIVFDLFLFIFRVFRS